MQHDEQGLFAFDGQRSASLLNDLLLSQNMNMSAQVGCLNLKPGFLATASLRRASTISCPVPTQDATSCCRWMVILSILQCRYHWQTLGSMPALTLSYFRKHSPVHDMD